MTTPTSPSSVANNSKSWQQKAWVWGKAAAGRKRSCFCCCFRKGKRLSIIIISSGSRSSSTSIGTSCWQRGFCYTWYYVASCSLYYDSPMLPCSLWVGLGSYIDGSLFSSPLYYPIPNLYYPYTMYVSFYIIVVCYSFLYWIIVVVLSTKRFAYRLGIHLSSSC